MHNSGNQYRRLTLGVNLHCPNKSFGATSVRRYHYSLIARHLCLARATNLRLDTFLMADKAFFGSHLK
jgi:hypothetical protein